jgi:hypothetical protein
MGKSTADASDQVNKKEFLWSYPLFEGDTHEKEHEHVPKDM